MTLVSNDYELEKYLNTKVQSISSVKTKLIKLKKQSKKNKKKLKRYILKKNINS